MEYSLNSCFLHECGQIIRVHQKSVQQIGLTLNTRFCSNERLSEKFAGHTLVQTQMIQEFGK
jgi:hypothetical protein